MAQVYDYARINLNPETRIVNCYDIAKVKRERWTNDVSRRRKNYDIPE